jgi:hypothetical protein
VWDNRVGPPSDGALTKLARVWGQVHVGALPKEDGLQREGGPLARGGTYAQSHSDAAWYT